MSEHFLWANLAKRLVADIEVSKGQGAATFVAPDRKISRIDCGIFIFGFALAAAYCPWITGAAATPRWAVLVIGAAVALVCLPRVRWRTAPVVWGCAFMGWALASLIFSPAFEGRDQAWKLALYAALFMAGGQMSSLRPFYAGAAAGLAISSALVIADLAGLIEYQQVARPSGLFVNGLYLAEFTAMVMAGLGGVGMWRWAVSCVPCLYFVALARGPILAYGIALYVQIMLRSRRDILIGFAVLWAMLAVLIASRPSTVIDRFEVWADLARNLTWLGHGLGAYFGDAPLFSQLVDNAMQRKLHANNDLLEIAYDLGAVGVIAAVGFVVSLLRGPMSAERLVILVFMVEGCFGFPFFLPWSAGLFCLAAGHVAGDRSLWVRAPDPQRIQVCDGHGSAIGAEVARSAD